MEMTSMISPFAQQLGQQTAGQIGQGMGQGVPPIPEDLQAAWRQAYAPSPLMGMAGNMLSQMFLGQPSNMPAQGMFDLPFFSPMGMGGMPQTGGMPFQSPYDPY